MTTTSTITPPTMARAWTRTQRIFALVFVVAIFAVAAFVTGRASIDTQAPTSVRPTPAAVVTPARAPVDVPCHVVARPC